MDLFERLRAERERAFAQGDIDLSPRPASVSQTVIVEVMEVQHVNIAGYVHGGTITRMVDTAAGIAAMRHCRRRIVTAAIDDLSFLVPVFVGDVVTVRAMVNEAFRTSMEVGARVEVEKLPTGERHHVSSAHLVFVGLDGQGRPAPVPPVVAQSEDEKRRQAQARVRREQRLLRKEALRRAAQDPASEA